MADSLFDAAGRAEILARLERLTPDAERQWGKMTAAQMLLIICASSGAERGEVAARGRANCDGKPGEPAPVRTHAHHHRRWLA